MNVQAVIEKIQALSNDYWRERFEKLNDDRDQKINDVIDGFNYLFSLAVEHIVINLTYYVEHLGTGKYLELNVLKENLPKDERDVLIGEADALMERINSEDIVLDKDTQALLEKLKSRKRFKRGEGLQLYNMLELEFLFGTIDNRYFRHNADMMNDFYYGMIYELFFAAGYGAKKFGKLSNARVQAAMNDTWRPTAENFTDLIWRYKRMALVDIKKAVEQLEQGVDLATTEERIRKAFKDTLRNLKVQLVTDSTYFSTLGEEEAFIELGIAEALYCAIIDDRTTEYCLAANGNIIAVEDIQPWINSPPLHYGCRSTLIPIVTKLNYLTGEVVSMEDYSRDTWYETFL